MAKRYTDGEVIALYSFWSEEFYAAGWMSPDPGTVKQFREWLVEQAVMTATEGSRRRMLAEYRKQEATASKDLEQEVEQQQ